MVLTKEIIFKRLSSAKIQQDSVEALSAWILHHVKNISTISRIWFDVFIGATDELKITLVYVLNDVLQKSRKMTGDLPNKISTCFFYHLRYGILISSDTVKAKIKRVTNILSTRNVISKNREEELLSLLDGKLFRVFPSELKSDNLQELTPPKTADVQTVDKYRDLINKLIDEEGILEINTNSGPDSKKPRLNYTEVSDAVENETDLMDSVVMAGNCLKTFAKKDAIQKANKEGKNGPYSDETLDLNLSKRESYMNKTSLPTYNDPEFKLKTAKKLRSLEIQRLKNELKPKKEESQNSYEPTMYDNESNSQSYEVEHYSPTAGDDSSSDPYNVYTGQAINSKEFLDSIPLPIPLNEIPLPSSFDSYNPSTIDAPPGVDDPSKEMSIVMPPPMPYDPTQMYSPTIPQQSYSYNHNLSKSQSYSPKDYKAENVSSRRSSSHEYKNDYDNRSRRNYDNYHRKSQKSRR